MVFTCMMSLVLWYSIVPFQCRKVCRWIAFRRGLLSLVAVRSRSFSNVTRRLCLRVMKTLSFFFGSWLSIPIKRLLIGNILSLLPFSAVMWMVLRCSSMSIHLSCMASPMRAPVSLSSWRKADVLVLPADMSESISCSVGMNAIGFSFMYLGAFQVFPMYFR